MNAELLAPAGSFEALEAALVSGADAVYLGGTRFGARAYADNLGTEDLCRAIDLVHRQDKKLYMTVNTLLKEKELEEDLYSYLLPYYREGLDGVIVQDLGVVEALRSWFPLLPVHGSTQMAITGAASAELLKKQGLTRVVPARELSLKEIREIYDKTGLEIETFIHGALCYSYSGMCLMSSLIGGRSGNRGRCAGTCRLPYEVYEKGKKINGPNTGYPLNTKDMCTLEILPEILDAGVCSLKIEGRMKKPEYTAGVVSMYRKYLDLMAENPDQFRVEKRDLNFLYDLFNRDGFHQSYYKIRNGKSMMALKNAKLTEAKQKDSNRLYESIRKEWKNTKLQRPVQGFLSLHYGEPARLVLLCGDAQAMVEKDGIQKAEKQPVARERVETQMNKTGNALFRFDSLEIDMDEDLFLPMQLLNELRREGMEELEAAITASFARTAPDEAPGLPVGAELTLNKESETAADPVRDGSGNAGKKPALWAMAETKEQYRSLLGVKGLKGISVPISFLDKKNPLESAEKLLKETEEKSLKLRLAMPYMVRGKEDDWYRPLLGDLVDLGIDALIVRSPESAARLYEAGVAEHCMLDYCLYTLNSQAQAFYRKHGFAWDTVPVELNAKEIRARDNSRSELIVYGRTPMMISAQCLKKNMDQCTKAFAALSLKDRKGMTFPVRCICDSCYNIIYNSLPTSLLKDAETIRKAGLAGIRIHFTIENGKETAAVAGAFARVFVYGEPTGNEKLPDFTRGHFKRGVE